MQVLTDDYVSVAPLGKTVLSVARLEYSGSNVDWQQSVDTVVDDVDQSLIEDCFKMSQRKSSNLTSHLDIYFHIAKHVSHVQVMTPKDETSGQLHHEN